MVRQEALNQRQFHSLLHVLRWALPLLVFLITLALELHEFFEVGHRLHEFAIFGLVMPVITWMIFSALIP